MAKTNKLTAFILVFFEHIFNFGGKEAEKVEESKFLFGTYIKIVVYK